MKKILPFVEAVVALELVCCTIPAKPKTRFHSLPQGEGVSVFFMSDLVIIKFKRRPLNQLSAINVYIDTKFTIENCKTVTRVLRTKRSSDCH